MRGNGHYRAIAAAALAGLSLAIQPVGARAQSPVPDVKFDTAKAAYEAMAESGRKAIQDALVWTGDYNGVVDASFGKRTFDAIAAFEKRGKFKADGIIEARERAALDEAAQKARQAVNFRAFTDERNGLKLSFPARVLDKHVASKTGTRLQSADGGTVLETISYSGQGASLQVLFDKAKTESATRKVSYKVFHPDWFVVTGEEQGRVFYMRMAAGQQGVRGYTYSYRTTRKADLDRTSIAIANSFVPFPEKPLAAAAAGEVEALPLLGFAASGLVVAPGKVLTVASMESCAEPTVGGQKARLVRADGSVGLALVDVAVPPRADVLRLSGGKPSPSDRLMVIGISALGGRAAASVAPGEADMTEDRVRVVAPLQRGAGGSAILDRSGSLVGVVAGGGPEPRMVAGVVPQASHAAIGAAEIETFLAQSDIRLAAGSDAAPKLTGEVVAVVATAIVPVECGSGARR